MRAATVVVALMVALMVALCAAPATPALAQSHADVHGTDVIHVHLQTSLDAAPLPGVHLAIYEVAQGSYFEHAAHLLADFDAELTHHDLDEMVEHNATASKDLVEWVEHTHPLAPLAEVDSDDSGDVVFDDLEDGVYLVLQEHFADDPADLEVTMEPFLVEVPMMDEDEELYGEVFATPKLYLAAPPGDTCDVHVEKHWLDDNDRAGLRPTSITVELVCDGEAIDTAQLSAACNWMHDWYGLETGHEWDVREAQVPAGYVCGVTRDGDAYVIENTLPPDEPGEPEEPDEPPAPPENPPEEPPTPPVNPPETPVTPDSPPSPQNPQPPQEKIAQTGDVTSWAPVMALVICSIVCLVASCALVRRRSRA